MSEISDEGSSVEKTTVIKKPNKNKNKYNEMMIEHKSEISVRRPKGPSDETLEQRVIRISEENLLLRKHLRKQEDKVKLLATKLVRVLGDRKSKDKRYVTLLESQKARITELEQDNDNLRDKLQVLRQQLTSYTKLIPHIPHHHTPSSARHPSASSLPKGTKSKKNVSTSRPSTGVLGDAEFTSKVEQLLLEAKAENQALEDQLRVTRDHLLSSEREVDRAHKKLQNVESSKQEELLRLRAQLDTEHERHKKKKQVSDNIQLIKLQRESRRTSSWLATLESQRGTLQESLNSANETVLQLESQLASLQDELREGQQKNLGLQKDLETCESQLSRLKELEASVDGLQDENRILKQTNESLLQRTLSTERFQGASTSSSGVNLDELRDLRSQLTQLETTLKIELKMKADAVHALAEEKMKSGQNERLVRDLREKVDKLERDGRIGQSTATVVQSSSQLEAQDGILLKKQINDLETELGQTQWQLVQVRDELDKTRSLLRTQMTINKEGQKEIEVLTQKLDRSESTHHEKLQEFMRILEQRAEQMSFLEKTLETIHFKGNSSSSMAAAPTDQTGSTSTPPPPRIVTINLDDDTTLRNKITEESGKGGQ